MIVSNGGMWLNSKDIRIVGALVDCSVQIYVDGINGVVNLTYSTREEAYAVRVMLILQLDPTDPEMKDTLSYLMETARANGFDVLKIQEHLDKMRNKGKKK